MNTMISNGIPCSWDENIIKSKAEIYNKIFQEDMCKLMHVLDKEIIHRTIEAVNQVKQTIATSTFKEA